MRPIHSRLQYRNFRQSQQRIYLMLGGLVVFLIITFYFGIPALFGLTGYISGLRHSGSSASVDKTVAPTTPVFVETLTATSSANAKISGVADEKETLEIFQNGRSLGTTVTSADGTFTEDVALERGDNIFVAQAVNDAGQKSALSKPYNLRFLSGNPKLDVSSPKDGDTVKSTPVAISGQTDPGDFVTVNDRLAIVSSNGSFSYSFDLSNGDNKVKIVSSDPAGNSSTKEMTVKYSP